VLVSYHILSHCSAIHIHKKVSICDYGVVLCQINGVTIFKFNVNVLGGLDRLLYLGNMYVYVITKVVQP